jgi:phytoene synthase
MAPPETPAPPGLSPLGGLARRHDPDRFLCALFAPAAKREALFALIACNHELARAREAARNPLIALMRLQWWREVVENAQAGAPARHHLVAEPLHAALVEGALDAEDLLGMIAAREAEAEESIPSREALAAYLRGSAGGLAVAAGRLLGARGPVLAGLQAAGAAYGLAGLLRNTLVLAAQGRCLLPEDALAEHGLTPAEVIAEPLSAGVRDSCASLASAVLREKAALPGLPRNALAAALPVVLARRDLRRLAAGRLVQERRGLGDRMAVVVAGLTGWV